MIIVNTPGSGATAFAPLEHAAWFGFTPTVNLVFPSFLFAVGNAMSFAMKKFAGQSNSSVVWKIVKRTALIFLFGYLMSWFPFVQHTASGWSLSPISHTRILGVLQRIALCYMFASLMVHFIKSTKVIVIISVLLLFGYWFLLLIFGYLHIKAMDQPSLAKFKKDLGEFRHKEGMVIDERWNGGGNIEQELLGILVQRPYEVWQPRGVEPTERPFNGYFGPKVVLQNWRSASNAEMFPAGFRALGLGKVVGTPTMGAVIGTGSYSLIDGSSIRTPGVGVFLSDTARTNMENHAVQPDVFVENTPEDNLAGRDRQLETAVREVMKELKSSPSVAKSGKE